MHDSHAKWVQMSARDEWIYRRYVYVVWLCFMYVPEEVAQEKQEWQQE